MSKISNILLIVCLALVTYLFIDKLANKHVNKIGIIQMDKLVYEFKGMKEATNRYTDKMQKWNNQSDSLESRLKDMLNQIRLDSLSKDQARLNKDIKTFMIFKQSYVEYVQNVQANADKEDKQVTMGVINQVNEYIKTYAMANGYDAVLTNTQQQSVGYAKDAMDITKEVLQYANAQYDGSTN
jgi:Skp family chaperone for outer membrane proteins